MDSQLGSRVVPVCSARRDNPKVVHGKPELESGVNSIETITTYRSDVSSGKVCEGNTSRFNLNNLPREHGIFSPAHKDHAPAPGVTIEPNLWNTGVCKARNVASSVRGSHSSANNQMHQEAYNRAMVGGNMHGGVLLATSVSETEEALSKLSVKPKGGVSGNTPVLGFPMTFDRGVVQVPIDHNVPSTRYLKPPTHVFSKNKYDSTAVRGDRVHSDAVQQSTLGTGRTAEAGYFWHRPFAKRSNGPKHFMGMPLVENVNPAVQKSWHLEAISALTREQYASLKMTMLRLTKSKTNLDPSVIFILSRNTWEVLQEGTFGTVYIGCVENVGNCALKVPVSDMVQQDPVGVMRRYINEWDILSRCDHPNIVKLYGGLIFGVFDIWLCTELIRGADLHSIKYDQYKKRAITPKASLKMCRQLADAIRHLHTKTADRGEVVHRDIKPENIIVMPNWDIKLCDFGDAFECNSKQVDNISGATWLYAPPELLKHKSIVFDILGMQCANQNSEELSEKWDIWSMGCVFQEMFGYSGPFHHLVDVSDTPAQICQKMVANAARELVPYIPRLLLRTKMGKLISQCLNNNPSKRPTAEQVCAILRQPDAVLLS